MSISHTVYMLEDHDLNNLRKSSYFFKSSLIACLIYPTLRF